MKTVYTYDAANRRLANLNAVRQGNTIFQNLSYSYDRVGNVLGLKNSVEPPRANEFGGPSVRRFEYDDLYRLAKAQGVFPANVSAPAPDASACAGVPTSHCRVYSLDLTYDTIHNITRKNQADTRIASKLVRQDTPNANPNGNTPFEKDLYFYHPDHLGSSNYITDLNGKLYEHLVYFPFGEGWIEENTNVQRTPYLFTAKELDEETGLYYFGARCYDPRTSVWQSVDPLLAKYLPSIRGDNSTLSGMGGVYNPMNLGVYGYGHLNPVKFTDPDGKEAYVGSRDIGGSPIGVHATRVSSISSLPITTKRTTQQYRVKERRNTTVTASLGQSPKGAE